MSTADRRESMHSLVSRLARSSCSGLRSLGVSGASRGSRVGRALRVPYRSCGNAAALAGILAELSPRVAIIDIEPLVAVWNTDQSVLDAGLAAFLGSFGEHPGQLRQIVFATNSTRRPSALPLGAGARVRYVSHAGKPLRIGAYRHAPGPGVVVGDQIATDGLLAWRLGLTFVHYVPRGLRTPVGPLLMHALGRPLRHVLFRTS